MPIGFHFNSPPLSHTNGWYPLVDWSLYLATEQYSAPRNQKFSLFYSAYLSNNQILIKLKSMDLTSILIILLAGLIIYLYLKFKRGYDYWSSRGVPSMKGTFPFGNVKDILLLRKPMGTLYQQIYRKFQDEPVCGFYKMLQPVLMVRKPELVRTILQKEYYSFEENDFHFNREADQLLRSNPFTITGEKWKEMRGSLIKAQSPVRLKSMFPIISQVCQPLIDYLNENAMKPLEAKYLGGNFTADSVSSCVFGCPTDSFKSPNSEFRRMSNKIINGEFFSNVAIILSFYAPSLLNIFPLRIIGKDVCDYFKKLIQETVDDRMMNGTSRNDIIQFYINENREAIDEGLPPVHDIEKITANCLNFYMDGYNTSSIVICFTLYELAKNTDCQEKARAEIRALAADHTELDYEKLLGLNYLGLVVMESMRLHPPLATMTRVCTRGTTISYGEKKWTIEAGTPVAVPVYALHMDPEYFENPKKFIPERFEISNDSDNKQSRQRYVYLPFGDGPRICPGIKFAQMQVKLFLATVLLNFEILPGYACVDDEGLLVPDPANSFMLAAKDGVWLKFKPLVSK